MSNNEKVAELKDRLGEALKIRGIRAIRLGEEAGIPKGAISYYLNGKTSPKPERLKIICKVLNVSEMWMLGYNVPMERVEIDETSSENPVFDIDNCDKETLNFGISKSVDILSELKIPEETIKQLILKHFDIRYSEITAILKSK